MPALTEVIEKTAPPKVLPKEDSDGHTPGGQYMVLIGVEKNPSKDGLVDKIKCGCQFSDDVFKYNFAVLTGIIEKDSRSSVLELENVNYTFFNKDSKIHRRSFEYGFLSNIGDKWYAILLHDEKAMLKKIRANKKIISRYDPIEELEECFIDLECLFLKLKKIKCTGKPLVFIKSYLGEIPIRVNCEEHNERILEYINSIRQPTANEKNRLDLEFRKYFAEKFMPFEEEFKNFITLATLPKEISNYNFMDLYGREIKRNK